MKVRWADDWCIIGVDTRYYLAKAYYSDSKNEIVLVRKTIESIPDTVCCLFHELIHYLIYRLKLPSVFHGWFDSIWERIF